MASPTEELERARNAFQAQLTAAATEQELRKVYADFAGPHGQVRLRQKEWLRAASPVEKKAIGQLTNRFLQEAEAAFTERLAAVMEELKRQDLARVVDVTLPGRVRRLGHLHPVTLVRREIEAILAQLGFVVAEGPQIETDFHNFEALAMPKDHPARDMQDTFYVAAGEAGDLVLRTHTSPVQIRTMLASQPPVRIIAPGVVYRKDEDATHSPMFTQVEALCVDEGVTFADLKGVLLHFAQRFFGPEFGVRLRPSFFPFTEPSAEIDFTCIFCGGTGSVSGAACRTCKGSGWIEVGGAGMVDPAVFGHVDYDAERYTGFAFGLGIDRMAMLRYRVDDIKLFFDGDIRFVRQFR